jgi:prepilin-type N-terminal cleavage/methylation domain-containing protein
MPSFRVSSSKKAFTIIELLVAIVVFALGLVAAYSLLQTATGVSMRSRDEIIGGNLLRERLELVKNVRDSNWIAMREWDSLRAGVSVSSEDGTFCSVGGTPADCRLTPGYYLVENRFSDSDNPVRVYRLSSAPNKASILSEASAAVPKTRLCVDSKGRYGHDCSASNEKTPFYSYVRVDAVKARDASGNLMTVSGALSVTATFVSTDS